MSEIILHIWPANWNLPSIDPSCLAAVAYLQLAIPGKFSIVECNNPDLSPTGQLPFLVHGQHVVTTLLLITKYIAALKNAEFPNPDLDISLDQKVKSQMIAWCAHTESNLGNLVYHTMYSHQGNWAGLTNPTLVSIFPVPQRYYVPGRMRESYRPRLEAAGLWNLLGVEKEEGKPFGQIQKKKAEMDTQIFLHTFEREKVIERARALFDIYARLLGDKGFFYLDRPTSLDIVFAAHVLLLLTPEYPDPFLKTLITNSYSTLAAHAHRVFSFDSSKLPLRLPATREFSWRSLVSWPAASRKIKKTEEDIYYYRMRWGFFGLAFGSLAAYLVVVGGARIKAISLALEKMQQEEEAEESEEEN